MKIAALMWKMSFIGGVNTHNVVFKHVARDLGYVYDVYLSGLEKNVVKYPRTIVKQPTGQSGFIVDGILSHHPEVVKRSLSVLADYDVIFLPFLCPHPTKQYGNAPVFEMILKGLKAVGKRIVGYIPDGYWKEYEEFAEIAIRYCDRVFINQERYKAYIPEKYRALIKIAPQPFYPFYRGAIVKERLLVWLPQWKRIKGVYPFVKGLGEIPAEVKVELYNTGIEWYRIKKDPELGWVMRYWKGWLPVEKIHEVLARASWSVDFQGFKAKYEDAYKGSLNFVHIEALYYGAIPVVYESVRERIPEEFIIPIRNVENWVAEMDWEKSIDIEKARQFVMDNFDAFKIWEAMFGGLG